MQNSEHPVEHPAEYRATVLIVDDSPANLTIFGEILQPLYHVRVANSGERALQLVNTDPAPDLILLDIMMPGMDGYCVLRELRDDPAHGDLPVIFVTALEDEESEEFGLALGAVGYITKPITPAILLANVRNQLELKKERDRLVRENFFLRDEVRRLSEENQELTDAQRTAQETIKALSARNALEELKALSEHPEIALPDTYFLDLDPPHKS